MAETTKGADVELLPCPFCGGEDVFIEPDQYSESGHRPIPPYYIGCKTCKAESPGHDTEADAITAWNTRTLSPTSAPPEEAGSGEPVARLVGETETRSNAEVFNDFHSVHGYQEGATPAGSDGNVWGGRGMAEFVDLLRGDAAWLERRRAIGPDSIDRIRRAADRLATSAGSGEGEDGLEALAKEWEFRATAMVDDPGKPLPPSTQGRVDTYRICARDLRDLRARLEGTVQPINGRGDDTDLEVFDDTQDPEEIALGLAHRMRTTKGSTMVTIGRDRLAGYARALEVLVERVRGTVQPEEEGYDG